MATEHTELSIDQLRSACDPNLFAFETTDDLEPLQGTVGQERGVSAVKFGFDIKTDGFNLFVAGPSGTGRNSTVKAFVSEQAQNEPVPDDLCYIQNFADQDSPKAIILPSGTGIQLVKDMEFVVESARREIPRTFESENYEKRRNDLINEAQQQRGKMISDLQQDAESLDLAIEMTNVGIATIPVIQGKPISREEFVKLPKSVQKDIEERSEQLQDKIQQVLAKARKIEKEAAEKINRLDREVALFAVGHLLDDLRLKYKAFSKVTDYLSSVENDMMDHLDDFKAKETPKVAIPGLEDLVGGEPSFDRYKVNLIVNNIDQHGAPIVVENNPTYYNLIGRVDFKARMGALTTDFSMIKPGALHKANGGYLILQALDVLSNGISWDALKRAMRGREVRIENIAEHYGLIPTSTLKPEPIPINVKVVIVGSPMIFHLLYAFDEDFRKLFKVKADFDIEMKRTDDHVERYAQFIAGRVSHDHLKAFDKTGVAKIVEYGSRLIQDQEKLSTRFDEIADLVSESSYWSSRNGNKYVIADDVRTAIKEKEYRSNLVEEKIQEMMEKGLIMIDTDGAKIGQVNGLSVYSIGDYNFGRPSRITARTFIGRNGVTNVEREVKMSGSIHDKGVLILSGYLSGMYGQNTPLPLGATLTFEQLYEGVEGDSASSAELYAILSSISGCPIKQNIAVTGSVNQRGEIQPIGGVIWKIEGFYEVCKAKGLTGDQGVMIPHQNVKHLMLRDEVIDAIRDGKFHVWSVASIDEGIELLTGIPAGAANADGEYPENTVHYFVKKKLSEYAERLKEFQGNEEIEEREDEDEERIAARSINRQI